MPHTDHTARDLDHTSEDLHDEPIGSPGTEARTALSIVPLTQGFEPLQGQQTREWSAALQLVEQAARKIRDYERKFVVIEVDARAFISRVDEEQKRLNEHILALEMQIDATERRAQIAEADLQAAKLVAWEEKLSRKSVEMRLAEAETELRNSRSYMHRIEDLLGSI